jgi:hypothetical protein
MAATTRKRKSTHVFAKPKKAKRGIAGNAPSGVDRRAGGDAEGGRREDAVSASSDDLSQLGGGVVDLPNALVVEEAVPWRGVWTAMKRSGWSWKGGSGIMTYYYYIKPKCRVQGGLSGRDYFVRVKDAMEFARDCYGWHNNSYWFGYCHNF